MNNRTMKNRTMNALVAVELTAIPRGTLAQNLYRMAYG